MSIDEAVALMEAFAERTGLSSDQPPERYLWTDAFAVCNYLGLTEATGEERFVGLASGLVEQVHHTLGHHRQDAPESGWLSGLDPDKGEDEPTAGGLRIGKPLPERAPDEPFDRRLEWERDGQYFHYLTRWMHALDQMARATGEPRYNCWARRLATVAHDAFVYRPAPDAAPRMYWKMSVGLQRPLVDSMGQHDPLDGYVTYSQLRATARRLSTDQGPLLENELASFARMVEGQRLSTNDPLGLGGLLFDAYRLEQLLEARDGGYGDRERAEHLAASLLEASASGVRRYARSGQARAPAQQRLAFRELGLAIGLYGAERMIATRDDTDRPHEALDRLEEDLGLRGELVAFWRARPHQTVSSWSAHRDINEVMLATALAPHGMCELGAARGAIRGPCP